MGAAGTTRNGTDQRRRIRDACGRTLGSTLEHHHYFGSPNVPSFCHMNITQNNTTQGDDTSTGSDVITMQVKNLNILSLPHSALATIKPLKLSDDDESSDETTNDKSSKKKKKKKKGKGETTVSSPIQPPSSPSEDMIKFFPTSVPLSLIEQTTLPSWNEQTVSSPSPPEISNNDSMESTNSSKVALNKQATISSVILSTVAVAMLAVFLLVSSKKRRTRTNKLNCTTDPALCGDASISSERSSTFRYDEERQCSNNNSQNSSNASKTYQSNETPIKISSAFHQNGMLMRLMSAVSTSTIDKNMQKMNHDKSNEQIEFFPTLSPYLIDEVTSTSSPIISDIHKNESSLHVAVNDVGTIVTESHDSDKSLENTLKEEDGDCTPTLETTVDVNCEAMDYINETSLNDHNTSYKNTPWYPYLPSTIHSREKDKSWKQVAKSVSVANDGGHLTKQKSLDEESVGSTDFISADIVKQFKNVDQRLSEGFEQFRAVDQRLSIEFDKLEATLVKNRQASKYNKNFVTPNTKKSESNSDENVTTLMANRVDSSSIQHLPPPSTESEINIDCDDDSSYDERSYENNSFIPYPFGSTLPHQKQRSNQQQHLRTVSIIDNEDPIIQDSSCQHTNYGASTYTTSILNLPNNSNSDDDDDDDILTASDDDKLTFEQIRSRFNYQKPYRSSS